jgi:hypothetical protein
LRELLVASLIRLYARLRKRGFDIIPACAGFDIIPACAGFDIIANFSIL